MLEMVENPSKEDNRLITKILRKEDKTSNSIESGRKSETQKLVGFPNLFLEFKQLKDVSSLDEITTDQSRSTLLKSYFPWTMT